MGPIDAKIDLANPRHLAAARGLTEGIERADPFVTFYWTRTGDL